MLTKALQEDSIKVVAVLFAANRLGLRQIVAPSASH
jgi:hypothetical protein